MEDNLTSQEGIAITQRSDVTIVMPCLNEQQTLGKCIDMAQELLGTLKEKKLSGEILISDNGSEDNSIKIAKEKGCKVAHCPTKGYGSALIHGINQAQGKYIIMGDSDGSYDFRQAAPMIEKLEEGFDICMGNRFLGEIKPGAMPWKNRYLGNPILSRTLNLFYKSNVHDAHCGLRAFTKKAFERISPTSSGMEFASELVVKAALNKLKMTELPVTLHKDGRDRAPHLRPWRDGWRHLKFLLLLSPRWAFFIPSGFLMLFSTLVFIALLLTPSGKQFTLGKISMGDHWMVLAGGIFTLGVAGWLFGMIATASAVAMGLRPGNTLSHRMVKRYSVEKVASWTIMCEVFGFGLLGWIVFIWQQNNFTGLHQIREMVLCTVFIITGMQIFLASLVIELIGMLPKKNEQRSQGYGQEPRTKSRQVGKRSKWRSK